MTDEIGFAKDYPPPVSMTIAPVPATVKVIGDDYRVTIVVFEKY